MTPERKDRIQSVLNKRQNDLTVVLENVFDPHNIAAIMRTCDAVGVQEIFVISNIVPLHKNWGFKSSRSANKWVSIHSFTDTNDCVEAVKIKYHTLLAAYVQDGTPSLYTTNLTGSTALVFGNEKYGVSAALLAACAGTFVIPQVGMIRSLNISVACAVSLYEALRQKMVAGHYEQAKLSEAVQNELLTLWEFNRV